MEQKIINFPNISPSCSYFTTNLFQAFTAEQSQENIVSASFSAYIVLSLLVHGSNGATKKELKFHLNLLNPDETQKELKYLLTSLNGIQKAELEIVNAMYIDNNFLLHQNFFRTSNNEFQTYIGNINFNDITQSKNEINTWINIKTKGKISHIIDSGSISEDTKIILINALYFQSSWLNPFDFDKTEKKEFYNVNNVVTYVPTMSKSFHLLHGYIETLDANIIKLQYVNEEFEMIIILPNQKYGLNKVEKKFNWDLINKAESFTKIVELSLPKFTIESTINLKTSLKKMGINSIFEKNANFSLMTENPLFVDHILQKVYIRVNEKGAEAAAATAVHMRSRRMIVDTENFIVDHPFMFIINYKPNSIPLFIGSIRKLGGTLRKEEL